MPHRDFPEIYTGGLSYWNALALRLFGIRLSSLRLMLFLSFLAFVPAVFAIASRFGSPLRSGLITLLAVAWSVPNYFVAMSVLVQPLPGDVGYAGSPAPRRDRAESLAVSRRRARRDLLPLQGRSAPTSSLRLFSSSFTGNAIFPHPRRPPREAPYLRLPAVPDGGARSLPGRPVPDGPKPSQGDGVRPLPRAGGHDLRLSDLARSSSGDAGSFARRFPVLWRLVLPFAAGALLPILLFLVPFAWRGALGDLWRGVVEGTGVHVRVFRSGCPRSRRSGPLFLTPSSSAPDHFGPFGSRGRSWHCSE